VRSNVPHAGGTLKEKTVWHCEQAVQDRTLLWKPMEKLGSSTSTDAFLYYHANLPRNVLFHPCGMKNKKARPKPCLSVF